MLKIMQIKVPNSAFVLQKQHSKCGFKTKILAMNSIEKAQNYQNICGC